MIIILKDFLIIIQYFSNKRTPSSIEVFFYFLKNFISLKFFHSQYLFLLIILSKLSSFFTSKHCYLFFLFIIIHSFDNFILLVRKVYYIYPHKLLNLLFYYYYYIFYPQFSVVNYNNLHIYLFF